MRNISFENFLIELNKISIDHLNFTITNSNDEMIMSDQIGQLYNQIKNLERLKYWVNAYTKTLKEDDYKLEIGEMFYCFSRNRFLHNIDHVGVVELQNITKAHNLNIAQILYLIVNIERVIFHN